jgi:hypothetical protein
MAYTQVEVRTPTAVGEMVYTIIDRTGVSADMTGDIQITILDQNGAGMKQIEASLNTQASAAVKAAFIAAVQAARAQAEAEAV